MAIIFMMLLSSFTLAAQSPSSAESAGQKDLPFGERSLMSNTNIAERVHRTGDVCLQGEDCAGQSAKPAEVVEVAAKGPRDGETVYNAGCVGCHAAGVLNAPKYGDGAAWQARLDSHGDFEGLWKSGWAGINSMPAKGACGDCSEEEFASAVQYMLDGS